MLLKRLQRNNKGRVLAVGDIHGHFSRLEAHLAAIGFDPHEGDILINVADMVDRGPESDQVGEWLAKPWFHSLLGNHEQMAIMWAKGEISERDYVGNGGGWNVANPPALCQEYRHLFEALPVAITVETAHGKVGLVHAECPLTSWDQFEMVLTEDRLAHFRKRAIETAIWSRTRFEFMETDHVEGVSAVVVGHTPVERMTSLGNTYYIDTQGWRRGHFTVLDLDTMRPLHAPSQELAFD